MAMMMRYKYCFFFSRKFLLRAAEPPADVKEAFGAYADGGKGGQDAAAAQMSAAELLRFLREVQGETGVALTDAERIVSQLRRHPVIGLDDFFKFLFSDELNPPIRSEVQHDMTLPLSQYYIYTGHNSYLTGNQISSKSSGTPIVKALQRGVRVIELDMWPNAKKNNINILHGRTLTRPVKMIKCLKSIKEHAFDSSPYPVVITLEDHLTPDLQAKAAEMITQTFGDMLYYPETDHLKEFPSPHYLKMRIIISTKPPKRHLEPNDSKKLGSSKMYNSYNSFKEERIADMKISRSETDGQNTDEESAEDQEEGIDDEKKEILSHSTPEYKDIITVPAGKPKGGMREALEVNPGLVRRLSLSEHKLAKAAASHGSDLVRFTQRNVLRVYPKGTRLNSSNYNPLLGWMHGAQMVAFNMQGHGRSLWLMQGLFRANGGCGYVKKPDFLLENGPDGEVFDPEASLPVKITLKVKIYMGDGWRSDFSKTHFDAFSPPDFYVKVGIAGLPADTTTKRTRTLADEWVPVWNEEFSFPLTAPELALLRLEVLDHDDSEMHDFGGQSCLPVWELRPGTRAVPLYDKEGNKYKSVRLLVRFDFV